MQILKDYLNKWLTEKNEEQTRIFESIKGLDDIIKNLKNSVVDPDNMDEELLNRLVPLQKKQEVAYVNMMQLKGWYKTYANQPQIKESIKYLTDLVNDLINTLKEQKDKLYSDATRLEETIKNFNSKYSFILEYNEETYIDEEKMEIISSLVSNMSLSEDIVNLFISIANNNNNIDNKRKTSKRISNNKLEEMNNARKRTRKRMKKGEAEAKLKEELITKVNNFINNEAYKAKTPNIHGEIASIATDFESSIAAMKKSDIDAIIELNNDIDYVELFSDKNELTLFITLGMIDAYEKADVDTVNKFLSAYKNSPTIKKVTLDSLDEEYGLYEKIEQAKTIVHNFNLTAKLKNYIKTFDGAEKSNILDTLKVMGVSSKDYYKGILKGDLTDLELKIKRLDGQVLTAEDVNSILVLLGNIETAMENIDNQDIEKEEEISMDSPYDKAFENYVIFLNPDRMEVIIENLEIQHGDKMYNGVVSRIQTLISNNLNELRKQSLNIHEEKGKPNPYDVMTTRGNIRVAYKIMENVNIDGHNVILVISPVYAPLGGNNTKTAYMGGLKEFTSNMDLYEQIRKELLEYKGNPLEEPHIRKGLERFTAMKERALYETDALGGK